MSKHSINHIHRYKKVNLGRNGKDYLVYKCVKPVCSHYIPLHLAEGKMCECNRCGEPMVITKLVMNGSQGGPMARPHCIDCTKKKVETDVTSINEFLEGTETKVS